MPKYIVTFPSNFYANQPIEIEASDTLWAVANLGMTVWTEEKWHSIDHSGINMSFKTKEPISIGESMRKYSEQYFNDYLKEHPNVKVEEYNGHKFIVMGDNSAETNS